MAKLSQVQRRALESVLKEYETRYDAKERMVRAQASKVGYHTTLRGGIVHPTRTSLAYAVALLDSGEKQNLERALGILRRVILLQDQDPQSKTYGIWSWYLEEPLEMMSPPDWNWADFCGVQLLAAYRDHKHRLPVEIVDLLKTSIIHAARSIERRNVTPSYTNIAIMGTYVTLVTAETFGLPDLLKYAKNRARRLHKYVTYHASFNEYNSPTYTVVAVRELSRILMDARDEQTRLLMKEIHDLAWRHIARHFHPPTRQWAGPHSRCYRTDLRDSPETLAFIQAGTNNAVQFFKNQQLPLGLWAYRIRLDCPEEWVPLFVSLDKEKTVVETFTRADPSRAGRKHPVVGTTFLGKHLTLGSVNYSHFWNQRRAILAYWGTPDQPAYLHVRFLHDGYDFCSALVATVQERGDLLAAVVLATDRGDTHPNLDPIKNATIRAHDLRLRFQFGADISSLKLPEKISSGRIITVVDRNVSTNIFLLGATFAGKTSTVETHRDAGLAALDVVLYSGKEEEFNFARIENAYIAFCLRLQEGTPEQGALWDAFARLQADRFNCFWRRPGGTFRVSVPRRPGPYKWLQDSFEIGVV